MTLTPLQALDLLYESSKKAAMNYADHLLCQGAYNALKTHLEASLPKPAVNPAENLSEKQS